MIVKKDKKKTKAKLFIIIKIIKKAFILISALIKSDKIRLNLCNLFIGD